MTLHSLDFARAENAAKQARNARHPLADLDPGELGGRTVVFTPTATTVNQLLDKASRSIGRLADAATIHRVISHNPDALWAIGRKQGFDARAPEAEGFVAFLMLNKKGLARLADGTLDRTQPDLALLAGQHERPAAIYTWAIYAPRSTVGAIPLIYEKISSPLYAGVDLYAYAATAEGKRFAETLGFTLGAQIGQYFIPQLYHFQRRPAEPSPLPPYDNYRPGEGAKAPRIAVARSCDDLMRVVAIRSATYMAEQKCPYDEEFDGNDLAATHLVGYIGDEPAGCIRIRFFADFFKMERLAVRPEFRTSKLSFRLVRAAVALARKKGYRRVYGHARKDIVKFWKVFGFRPMPGRNEFAFSDVGYVEMSGELPPDPDAIAFGDDPYVLIRPEGRWHEPGILERSAERGAQFTDRKPTDKEISL